MQNQLELTRDLHLDDIRKLANASGPCITVTFPTPSTSGLNRNELHALRPAMQQVDQRLESGWPDLPRAERRELVQSLQAVSEETAELQDRSGGSLVILRSPDVFRAFHLNAEMDSNVFVGSFFHIFPMLHALDQAHQQFYLLGISQKHVRLLHCTRTNASQLEFPAHIPTNLEDFLNTRLPSESPRHNVEKNGTNGNNGNFTSTTDRDNKDQFIAHFFRNINKGVFELLRGQEKPLVLCAVDYELTMYREINTYPHLCPAAVHGSPESFKGGEMHARALESVQDFFSQPAQKAMEQWERVTGSGRSTSSFPDVVKAAFEGRISHLFAKENAQTMGVFDRETMQMRVQGRQEDLVNAAALQTLAHGGDVFVVKPDDVPGGGQMSAILRY